MWELLERRIEAEHYLGPSVRAQRLVEQLVAMPAEPDTAALRAELDSLAFPDLRAFYHRVIELTGGPDGLQASAEAGRWLPYRDRLLALRAAGSAALADESRARTDQLAACDLHSVQACTPVDKRIEVAVRAAVAGQAVDEDAVRLAAAVRDYRRIESRAPLSAGGRRLLRYKIANALDSLARACQASRRDAEAMIHFGAAAAMYGDAGEPHLAAACVSQRDAAGQRLVPDADTRLEQLLAELATTGEPSVERAAVLVGLAELAHGNSDEFEARRWLAESIAELASARCAVPGPAGTDHAVEEWIEAIPPGDCEDPNHFPRQISARLTLHSRVAAVRMAVTPEDAEPGEAAAIAEAAEAQLNRLAAIVMDIPAHARAVQARLEAELGPSAARGDQAENPPDPGAEYLAIMGMVTELLRLTGESAPGTPEEIARCRQLADDCVTRARALGRPVTLAQALDAAARVLMVTGEPQAAIGLFEEEYEQAGLVGGKLAVDQAILAMTSVAKIQLGLGLGRVREASDAAGRVITLIERDRYRVSAPFQQAALLAPHADVFAIGVFSAWKNADYDTMLQRMELSKARASVRQLFLTGARDVTGVEDELAALNDEIHALDPAAERAQQELRRRRLQLWDRRAIARRDPEAEVPPVTLKGVQALLEPDEAVLCYYWLRPLTLLVVTITADAIAVESKRVEQHQRTALEGLIAEVGSMRGGNLGLDAAYIEPLASVLTPVEGQPLLDGKQRLIVSAHRLLHWYPFAAMPYQGQPLVRSFALRYVPNLASLLVPRPGAVPPRMAALAVSEFPGRPELRPLRGAHAEAAQSAAIYSAAGIPVATMSEPARADVLGALRDGTFARAWCLILATHGHSLIDEVSKDAPLESVLELADDSIDGYEIAAAGLGCEVVVLTACYAGQRAIGGRGMAEQPGDELFGLSAAFLQARCGSVLAPVWPAEDAVMAKLMTGFHRNLAQGFPADVALARAQRAFLDTANAKERRAYYWASVVLTAIGRPRTLPPREKETRDG